MKQRSWIYVIFMPENCTWIWPRYFNVNVYCKYGYILHVIYIHIYIYINTHLHIHTQTGHVHTRARALFRVKGGEEGEMRKNHERGFCITFFADVLMSLTSNFLAKHLVRSVRTTRTRTYHLRITCDTDASLASIVRDALDGRASRYRPLHSFYTPWKCSRPSKEILIFIKAVQLNFCEDISSSIFARDVY